MKSIMKNYKTSLTSLPLLVFGALTLYHAGSDPQKWRDGLSAIFAGMGLLAAQDAPAVVQDAPPVVSK